MVLQLKSIDFNREKLEYLIIPVYEKSTESFNGLPLNALVQKAFAVPEFEGKKSQSITFFTPPEINAGRVDIRGLGEANKIEREDLRSMAGITVKSAIGKKLTEICFVLPHSSQSSLDNADIIEAVSEGACLANHVFDIYKKEKEFKPLKKIILAVTDAEVKKYRALISRTETICEGTRRARDWVSIPSNDKYPEILAKEFTSEARNAGLETELLDEKELRRLKFGALLAVSAGSEKKPFVITMQHRTAGAKKTALLVGKGITFDSGGINLKQSAAMDSMKMDMAGAAAVAATLITAARLKLKMNLIGIMPLVENMPSGKATRPGDIIRSFQGKTIEIGNTDAEGRLILADTLAYGIDRFKPDITVDLATLTGACVTSLGEKIAGVFTADDILAQALTEAGKKTHERCWRLPLPADYKELIKSELADIRNMSSSTRGGAITAALFLSDFTENTRWAHVDIAGTAFLKQEAITVPRDRGSGYGVRLLIEMLKTVQESGVRSQKSE